MCHIYVEQVDLDLPWGVLSIALDVTIPDSPASAGSPSTGGAGVEVLVHSTPAMGASFSSCPMLELMGSKIVPM